MTTMNGQRLRLVLIISAASVVLGVGTSVALAAASHRTGRVLTAPWPAACATPALSGAVVDVTLTDMGPMGPGMTWHGPHGPNNSNNGYGWQNGYPWPGMSMQRIFAVPSSVAAGQVSLRVHNTGALTHEVMVLPLSPGQYPGQRAIGASGQVDESGSLGEASRSCGADKGDGSAPGANAWTTLSLAPGRYELLCNIAGHYGAGMYSEVDAIANR
jgi:hypothetical protein